MTKNFHPPIGKTSNGGAIVPFLDTLYYMFPDSGWHLYLAVGDMTGVVQDTNYDSLRDSSSWSRNNLASNIGNKNGASLQTYYRPAMAIVEQTKLYFAASTLYMFWVDRTNSQVYATFYDLSSSTWAPTTYLVEDATGAAIQANSSVSVVKIGRKLKLSWFDTSTIALASSLFDVEAIGDSTWRADYDDSPLAFADVDGLDADSSYATMSTEYFSQGNAGDFLVAAFYSSSQLNVQSFITPINRDPKAGIPLGARSEGDICVIDTFTATYGVDLVREPSGRICCFHGETGSNAVCCRTLSTYDDPATVDPLEWGDPVDHGLGATKEPITAGFIFGAAIPNQVTLLGADGSYAMKDCQTSLVSTFIAYASGKKSNHGYDIQCFYSMTGQTNYVPDYNEYAPELAVEGSFPITTVFDPFPFPNQNIGGATSGSTMIQYTYGTSSTTVDSAKVAWKVQFGVRADFNTTKGVGPAADFEFRAGPTSTAGSSIETRSRVGRTLDTALIEGEGGQGVVVSPRGRADGVLLPTVKENAALFYIGGQRISGVSSPLYSALVPVPGTSGPESTGYDVYSSTPGDMSTYSETSINATMKQLYDNLPAAQQAEFPPGYASDYIQDVIEPHAQTTASGAKYLTFRVTANGGELPDFSQISTTMIESGVAIDGKTYLGVGFGAECSLFGMGEGFSGKVLAGFEFGAAVTSGVTDSKEWGVSAAYSYPAEVQGALNYTVKMYICEPSPLWARELRYMTTNVVQGAKVDWDSSVPMKIMFVVDSVSENIVSPQVIPDVA